MSAIADKNVVGDFAMLYAGCLVEMVENVPASHPLLDRDLIKGDRFQIQAARDGKIRYTTIRGDVVFSDEYVKLVPTVGAETARDDLVIDRCFKDDWFVYRKNDNQILCQGVEPALAPFKMYRPIVWDRHVKAEKWVNEGCIADIQESLGNLDVRFTKVLVVASRLIGPAAYDA